MHQSANWLTLFVRCRHPAVNGCQPFCANVISTLSSVPDTERARERLAAGQSAGRKTSILSAA